MLVKNWFEMPEFTLTGDESVEQLANNGSRLIIEFVKEYWYIVENDKIPFDGFVLTASIDTFLCKIKEENEDLKHLSLNTLKAMLRFITSLEDIKLSGLILRKDHLQIIPHAFATIDHIENIYNEILERLYNNQKRQKLGITEPTKDKEREHKICNALAEMFNKRFGNKAKIAVANVDFGANGVYSGDLRGEFDVIALDEINKAILCIEVKLKNTYLFNRRGRWIWFQDVIMGNGKAIGRQDEVGAKQQIEKYYKYFQESDCGKNQIKALFQKEIDMNEYKFFTLIITDNFYFDHCQILYKGGNLPASTQIISFFESKALLENLSLFKENTYDWVLYHYTIISHKKEDIKTIDYLNTCEKNQAPSQEVIDFIQANKISLSDVQMSVPILVGLMRKSNLLWYPLHKYSFE